MKRKSLIRGSLIAQSSFGRTKWREKFFESGKKAKKALNNKVRNRFFHVTQFTRRKSDSEWHTSDIKPPKRKWSESRKNVKVNVIHEKTFIISPLPTTTFNETESVTNEFFRYGFGFSFFVFIPTSFSWFHSSFFLARAKINSKTFSLKLVEIFFCSYIFQYDWY